MPAFCIAFFLLLFSENVHKIVYHNSSTVFVYVFRLDTRNIYTSYGFPKIYLFRNLKCEERKLFDVKLKLFCLMLWRVFFLSMGTLPLQHAFDLYTN